MQEAREERGVHGVRIVWLREYHGHEDSAG